MKLQWYGSVLNMDMYTILCYWKIERCVKCKQIGEW